MNSKYQMELVKAKEVLATFELSLFTSMVNLLMEGELSAWNEQVPINEDVQIDLALLQASKDENIVQLMALHSQLITIIKELNKT